MSENTPTQFPPTLNVAAVDEEAGAGVPDLEPNTRDTISAAYDQAAFTLHLTDDVSANPAVSQRVHDAFLGLLLRGGPTPFEQLAEPATKRTKRDSEKKSKKETHVEAESGDDEGSEVFTDSEEFLPNNGAESDPDDDILDFDKVTENESDASLPSNSDDMMDDAGGGDDPAFTRWLEGDGEFGEDGPPKPHTKGVMEWELNNLQLTDADTLITTGELPERFAEAAMESGRDNINSAHSVLAAECRVHVEAADLARTHPAFILSHLCRPGCMLAHSQKAGAVLNLPPDDINAHPLTDSIRFAVHKMVLDKVEPAHLAMYYFDNLKPLLDALWDGVVEGGTNGFSYVAESYPYSTVTGRRQRPIFETPDDADASEVDPRAAFSRFDFVATHPTVPNELDPMWRSLEGDIDAPKRCIRRPLVMELGRLLWAIFDLNQLFQKIELGRGRLVMAMHSASNFSPVHFSILDSKIFVEPCELEFWEDFARSQMRHDKDLSEIPRSDEHRCLDRANKNWLAKSYLSVVDLRLDHVFADLYLPADTFHSNLNMLNDDKPNPPPAIRLVNDHLRTIGAEESLMEWLRRCGSTAGKDLLSTIQLFSAAFVEQYTELPLVQLAVFKAFMTHGVITFYPNTGSTSTVCDALKILFGLFPEGSEDAVAPSTASGASVGKSMLIAQLMGSNALLFLEAHRHTILTGGKRPLLRAEFHLDVEVALSALKMNTHFFSPESNPTLEVNQFRRESFTEMTKCVIGRVTQYVRQAMVFHANQVAALTSMTELGKWASEGPYQPTRLALSQYDPAAPTWEPMYNVVESLPDEPNFVPGSARVCAAVRTSNGTTATVTFAFCNEFGKCEAQVSWQEVNVTRPAGRAAHERQCHELLTQIGRFTPNVIAVAATSGSRTSMLFRTLRDFVQNYVVPAMYFAIPVVWVPFSPAVVFRHSEAANREHPDADVALRSAIACARYLRDPLLELCRYFSAKERAVLGLPLAVQRGADEDVVYKFLEREMSLWVSATGFSASTVFSQSHAESVLQFCAGLGARKAKALVAALGSHNITSRSALREAVEAIGGAPISANFLPTLRILPTTIGGDLSDVDPARLTSMLAGPFDRTLIPDAWQKAANVLASLMVGYAPHELIAWAQIDAATPDERFEMMLNNFTQQHFVECFTKFNLTGDQVGFIFDEIFTLGEDRCRRGYRKMTSRRLLLELTGVSYYSKADLVDRSNAAHVYGGANAVANPCQLSTDLTLREGDVLECAVAGVRLNPRPVIRLRTNRELEAVLGTEERDFDDAVRRPQLMEYLEVMQELQDERDRVKQANGGLLPLNMPPIRPGYEPPAFLKLGAPVYGEIVSFNSFRCEFRVKWTDAMPTSSLVFSAEELLQRLSRADREMLLMDDGIFGSSRHESSRGSVAPTDAASIQSVDITRHEVALTTKASRHRLFRNCNNAKMLELHQRTQIGEMMLRPCPEAYSNWVLLCVKMGAHQVCNWPIKELRNHTGAAFYEIRDRRSESKQSFESIDHIAHSFVRKLIQNINSLRNHRAFRLTLDAATSESKNSLRRVADAANCETRLAFGYAFCEYITQGEIASGTTVTASTVPYRVVYYYNDEKHIAPVHVTNNGIYIKLRQRGGERYGWLQADTAEGIATKLKAYVSARLKIEQRTRALRERPPVPMTVGSNF